jgi:hypothetical protein
MIIGHVGVAFAAKARWPRIPLGALLVATFATDILRELLGALSFPPSQATVYSHALPWSVLLAACAGALAWIALRDRTAFLVVFGVVLSHVLLDLISGNKPLWSGGPRGIHLAMVEPIELFIETAIMLAGWYRLRRNASQSWLRHWAVPALLFIVQVGSVVGAISQRPYATRCLVSPMGTCSGGSLLTRRWETTPFW